MAFIVDNLILETCSVALATTDPVALQGTLPGYRTFSSKCAVNDTLHYMVRAVDVVGRPTGDWEAGRGTITQSGGNWFITRNLVVASSNGDALVAFSAGMKHVTIASLAPAIDQIRFDQQSALGLDFVGCLQYFATTAAPPGWLKANGAAVSRTTYARLFARIGTVHGAGDGTTTFNLPEGRGEFLRGLDDGRGIDAGRALGSVQTSQNLSHNHGVTDSGHAHSLYDPGHAHTAWTDAQGYHDHANGLTGADGGTMPSGRWDNNIPQWGMNGGHRTEAAGSHAHNVGVGAALTGMGVNANYTGISIQAGGGTEARPRNLSALICVKY